MVSQKDVPGSSLGFVDAAVSAGISALHVGVNDFSQPPAVPQTSPVHCERCHAFNWQSPKGNVLHAFWCR